MNAQVYVNIDQGIHKGKMKVTQNEKRKKLLGFSFYINIGNFEAFLRNLNLSAKHLFWRCGIMIEMYFNAQGNDFVIDSMYVLCNFSKLYYFLNYYITLKRLMLSIFIISSCFHLQKEMVINMLMVREKKGLVIVIKKCCVV